MHFLFYLFLSSVSLKFYLMILSTVSQAAIYANVTKSAVVHWIVQGYLPREEAEYGIWIDPGQLDVILKTSNSLCGI
jgi:hypothetical protein